MTDKRRFVLISIIVATFMISIEATIVSTAMPQILGSLGNDISLYSWVFSVFLLAQTATTMVFGKLADIFGRKPVLLVGIMAFLVSSLLCGLAWSMMSLIVFRLFQGFAAGSLQPVMQTLIGDLYPGEERGRVQGYVAAAYGVSSVFGPLAGGLIVQYAHWAWIFWINIPIGLLAALGFYVFIQEEKTQEAGRIDIAGPALFVVSISAFMMFLNDVSTGPMPMVITYLAVFLVGMAIFLLWERRHPRPMLSLELLSRPHLARLNLLSLLCGAILIGVVTFLPVYVQVVMGRSPLVAGFTLTAQVFGWTLAAMFAVNLFKRIGHVKVLTMGAACLFVGVIPLIAVPAQAGPFWPGLGSLSIGIGLGLVNTTMIVSIQEAVGWSERGIVTSMNIFARNLGSAVGAAALGAMVNAHIAHAGASGEGIDVKALLERTADAAHMMQARTALNDALHLAFWAMLLIAGCAIVMAMLTGRSKEDRQAKAA